ncbi:MAG: transcriptional regulator NrdR [Patescibacteria group bacterium]|nr:transcriptional regulator NrdR [Patescibacteria group bacterium]
MKCPFCGSSLNKVVDKRSVVGSGEIRRRRECLKCLRRFTTYERLGILVLMVAKKDGRKEPFNREKLRMGIVKALEKRPIINKVDEIVERIERKIRRRENSEITSKLIGQAVLSELKKADHIAYLRFASVYRQFEQPEDFRRELTSLEGIKP